MGTKNTTVLLADCFLGDFPPQVGSFLSCWTFKRRHPSRHRRWCQSGCRRQCLGVVSPSRSRPPLPQSQSRPPKCFVSPPPLLPVSGPSRNATHSIVSASACGNRVLFALAAPKLATVSDDRGIEQSTGRSSRRTRPSVPRRGSRRSRHPR